MACAAEVQVVCSYVAFFRGEMQKFLARYETKLRSSETGMTRRFFPTLRVRSSPERASRRKLLSLKVVSLLAVLKSTAKPLGAGGGARRSISCLRLAGMVAVLRSLSYECLPTTIIAFTSMQRKSAVFSSDGRPGGRERCGGRGGYVFPSLVSRFLSS